MNRWKTFSISERSANGCHQLLEKLRWFHFGRIGIVISLFIFNEMFAHLYLYGKFKTACTSAKRSEIELEIIHCEMVQKLKSKHLI